MNASLTVEQEFIDNNKQYCFDVWEMQNESNEDRDLLYVRVSSPKPITEDDRNRCRYAYSVMMEIEELE